MNATIRTWVATPALLLVLALPNGTTALAAGAGGGSDDDGGSSALGEAQALISEQRYEEALAALKKVVAKDRDEADAWNLIGFSHRRLGNHDLAMDGYSRALAIDPRHTEAMEYLGELYLELDDPQQAEALLTRLAGLCPSGCEEYDTLKESVDRYKAARGG